MLRLMHGPKEPTEALRFGPHLASVFCRATLMMTALQAGDAGASRLVFCIGGPFGHSQAVRDRANSTVRLSNMVLNHQVFLSVGPFQC